MKNGLRAFAFPMAGLLLVLLAGCPDPNPIASSSPASTPAPLTDSQAVAAAKSALAIGYQVGDSASSVTKNLSLPATGSNSVSISWSTDDAVHASAAGIVARPALGQPNAPVVLTATLSRGTATDTKAFNLSVLASVPGSFVVAHDWTSFGSVGSAEAYCAIQDVNRVCIGTLGKGLIYSNDGGSTWNVKNVANDGIASNYVYEVAMRGDLVFMGTFSGLSVWDRNASGSGISNFVSPAGVYDVIVDGSSLYLATNDGVYHGTASTVPGLALAATSFSYPVTLCLSGNSLYAAGDSNSTNVEPINVFDTTNWSTAPVPIDVNEFDNFGVGPVWANGNDIFIYLNNQTLYSTNSGSSFSATGYLGSGPVTGIVPMGTALLCVRYGSDLWLSSDSGANWTNYVVPGYDSWLGISANGVSYDGSEVLIAHNGGVVVGTFN